MLPAPLAGQLPRQPVGARGAPLDEDQVLDLPSNAVDHGPEPVPRCPGPRAADQKPHRSLLPWCSRMAPLAGWLLLAHLIAPSSSAEIGRSASWCRFPRRGARSARPMQARGRVDAGSRRLVFGGRGRPLAAARRTPLEVVKKLLTACSVHRPDRVSTLDSPTVSAGVHSLSGRVHPGHPWRCPRCPRVSGRTPRPDTYRNGSPGRRPLVGCSQRSSCSESQPASRPRSCSRASSIAGRPSALTSSADSP
jgi:hypothetical protein